MLDSAGSTLVEWGRQQQQHVVKGSCGGVFGFEAVLCMMLWDVVSDVW